MKLRLISLLLVFTATLAQASPESEMVALNLKDRSWSEELKFMQDFAVSSQEACQTWSPHAFRVQKYLWDACEFNPLLKRYLRKLRALPNKETSGVVLPALQIKESLVPALQSGAWQSLIFSEVDGFRSALEIIFLRIALQKSLVAQANLIRQQNPEHFNSFAALVIPRMLSALSGYSQTLQRLVFIDAFQCGATKTPACRDAKDSLNHLRDQLAIGLSSEDFFAGLENMNEENSSRDLLKAQHVKSVVQELQKIKNEKSLQQILSYIDDTSRDADFLNLQTEIGSINGNGVVSSSTEQSHMLVAVSTIAEITEMQQRTAGFKTSSVSKPGLEARKTTEEMNRLKSFALNVLRQTEEVQ